MQVEIGNMTKEKREINNMDRETVLQNITNNYENMGLQEKS